MKTISRIIVCLCLSTVISLSGYAQCSVCTKTALQMGEKPAKGLNQGIIYLMLMPFAIVGYIGFRWWKGQQAAEENE